MALEILQRSPPVPAGPWMALFYLEYFVMKKKWYCIIQGRDPDYYSWKQIIKDLIIAPTKKEARVIVESEYLQSLPMRIKRENIKPESLLLSLYEVKEDSFVNEFFEFKKCLICNKSYRLIDKFNFHGFFGNYEACSHECNEILREKNFQKVENLEYTIPVIYKITQISTGKVYIGKTIRAFTLRWWEHIKSQGLQDKFHSEICNTDITDWTFQVIKTLPKSMKDSEILRIEQEYINKYNSVSDGFNTIGKEQNIENQEELFKNEMV